MPLKSLPADLGEFVLTWDIGVILFGFIAVFFWGLNAGRKRLSLFVLSLYGSIALLYLFPQQILRDIFGNVSSEIISLGLLIAFTVAIYFIVEGSVVKVALPIPRSKGNFWQILVITLALSGFLVSIIGVLVAPLISQESISTITRDIFLSEEARFIWGALPFMALFAAARNKG